MLDGKKTKYTSGGNTQREAFMGKAMGGGGKDKGETKVKGPAPEKSGDGSTTTITHNGDGSHTVEHADGEHSEHPSMGHLAMHMHGKHEGGMAMHAAAHDSGVTTHHVGHDGMVEGPHEHGSADEAGEHMKSMLGEDGGNGAMEQSDGMEPGGGHGGSTMPTLY